MKTYTIMLLYPDYASDQFGREHFVNVVKARTIREAVKKVRKSACEANTTEGNCQIHDPEDFAVIAAFAGEVTFLDTTGL